MINGQHRSFVVQPHNLFTYADPKGSETSAGKQHSTNFRAFYTPLTGISKHGAGRSNDIDYETCWYCVWHKMCYVIFRVTPK
jgi:hypothetical protein